MLCDQCHTNPLKPQAFRYCSRLCAKAAEKARAATRPRLTATGVCPRCGNPTSPGAIHCSSACAHEARALERGVCEHCGGPKRRRRRFCGKACADLARTKPPRFCRCGAVLSSQANTYCSTRCAADARMAARRAAEPPDLEARVRAGRAAGDSLTTIAERIGVPHQMIKALCSRLGIYWQRVAKPAPPPKAPKAAKLAKAAAPAKRRHRRASLPDDEPGPRAPGVRIPLREVYRYAAELGLPRSRAGDIAAVSAAMRRVCPGHPGFLLETAGARRGNILLLPPPP